jgi:5-formyltetrahydrofolate cyclo-ligase
MANSPQQPHPDKAALRQRILQARDGLEESQRLEGSRRIVERVVSRNDFFAASGVHCFISLPGEVNTQGIFEACWSMGKAVYVPYVMRGERRLGWARREQGDALVTGQMNLQEPLPENRREAPLEEIQLLLIPGVAFDRKGRRLGYGKGYYDKFLGQFPQLDVSNRRKTAQLREKSPPKIGLAFSVQIVDAVPQDSWDLAMDAVVTELGEWSREQSC